MSRSPPRPSAFEPRDALVEILQRLFGVGDVVDEGIQGGLDLADPRAEPAQHSADSS